MAVCGFCKGGPVGDAASWLDGKPRPPAPCPRCGEVYACAACDGTGCPCWRARDWQSMDEGGCECGCAKCGLKPPLPRPLVDRDPGDEDDAA